MAENLDASQLDDDMFNDGGEQGQQQSDVGVMGDAGAGQSNDDGSVINDLLAANGISDASKIKFEEDDGTITERNWNDLTKEEKLGILGSTGISGNGESGDDVVDFSQEEIDFIQKIRSSAQSPTDYVDSLIRQTAGNQAPQYEIDGISDDELFVLDALDRYGEENVTDEQLQSLLENAKSDTELYTKTIESLRAQYKQREDELKLQEQQQSEARQEQEFQAFSNSILNEIQSLKEVAGQDIELSLDDMNELANYILTRDEEGNSEFGKAMNDPKLFTQMAFWALKGNDIMNEISSQIKMAYEKGVEAGKGGQSHVAFRNSDRPAHIAAGESAFGLDVQ